MIPKKHSKSTLFELVSRLSVAELRGVQRGFKSLQPEKQPTYIQLLDLVANATETDDEGWYNILNSRSPLAKDEYRQVKKYLNDRLVDLLVEQQEISPRVNIGRLITQAEVFYLRGLLNQALVVLHQAKLIAREYEFLEEELTILEWLNKVYLHEGSLAEANSTLVEMQQLLVDSQQLKTFQALYTRLLAHERRNESGEHPLSVDSIEVSALTAITSVNSIRARLLGLAAAGLHARQTGKYEAAQTLLQQCIALLQQHPNIRLSNPNLVIDSYRNLGLVYLALGQHQQLFTFLQQLEQVRFLSSSQNQKLELLIARLGILAHIHVGDVLKAGDIAQARLSTLTAYQHDTVFRTEVAYAITVGLVLAGHHSVAIKELAKLVNSAYIYGKHSGYEGALRLMELCIHTDLGDGLFVKNRIRSYQHFLKAHYPESPQHYLAVLQQLARAKTKAEKAIQYQELLALYKNPVNLSAYVNQDGWALNQHLFSLRQWAQVRLIAQVG